MDRSTRLDFIKQGVMRLGLLLPKYDLQLSPACSARRQADAIVDDILRTTLTWQMLDAKQYMSLAMVNLENQQYEPYPPGYWMHVAEAVLPMLSQDQVEAFLTEAPASCSSTPATPATPGSGTEESNTEATCQKQMMQLPDALAEVSLLQVACREQLELEQELDRITQQLKWPHFCHLLHLINILTKQQLATGMLHSYPYMPDAFSCE
eukprot:gene5479-5714_t